LRAFIPVSNHHRGYNLNHSGRTQFQPFIGWLRQKGFKFQKKRNLDAQLKSPAEPDAIEYIAAYVNYPAILVRDTPTLVDSFAKKYTLNMKVTGLLRPTNDTHLSELTNQLCV
jgi:hypothetical protein